MLYAATKILFFSKDDGSRAAENLASDTKMITRSSQAPSQTSQQHTQHMHAQHAQQHADIEAAIHTLPAPPSRNLNHQQDGDPFHRRTSAGVATATGTSTTQVTTHHSSSGDMEAILVQSDALGSSVRSGNYATLDSDLVAASRPRSNGTATLPSSAVAAGKLSSGTQDPRLLHPYVLCIRTSSTVCALVCWKASVVFYGCMTCCSCGPRKLILSLDLRTLFVHQPLSCACVVLVSFSEYC
jgi:hypothetical protein